MAGLALLAPLVLSGCMAEGDRLIGTASAVSPDPQAQAQAQAAAAATGKPTVVTLDSESDGGPTRVALPANRPASDTQVAEARGTRVTTPMQRETAERGTAARAVEVASAAGSTVRSGVVAAKDSVVAGATTVASVSTETARSVAQAVKETITGDPRIDQLIAEAADENDIPRELAFAVVRVESHYNPRARGAGVYGLSQIKPATARGMGFTGSNEDLFDPKTNLRYGMRYLRGAWEQGGEDVCRAAMKYKGGHRTTTMSRSASVYCANVKRHMASYRTRNPAVLAGPNATLVAAVEPTVRRGLIARTVAVTPKQAPRDAAAAVAATVAAPAAAMPSPASATALAPQTDAPAAPAAAPRPAAVDGRVAENRVQPVRAEPKGGVGGRVHRAAPTPQPDADRFGGAFDASGPSAGAPSGGLGFN